jgi:hypothetical protein
MLAQQSTMLSDTGPTRLHGHDNMDQPGIHLKKSIVHVSTTSLACEMMAPAAKSKLYLSTVEMLKLAQPSQVNVKDTSQIQKPVPSA